MKTKQKLGIVLGIIIIGAGAIWVAQPDRGINEDLITLSQENDWLGDKNLFNGINTFRAAAHYED